MYKITTRYLAISLISLFMLSTLLFTICSKTLADEKAPEATIKTITLKVEPAGISPNPLKVKLGTTIVWYNNDAEAVTIKFTDKLGIACKAPVNFYSDLWGYYETGMIPQGGTASICFINKGDYAYEVRRVITEKGRPTEQISTGKITAVEP
jgi:plastocyanin